MRPFSLTNPKFVKSSHTSPRSVFAFALCGEMRNKCEILQKLYQRINVIVSAPILWGNWPECVWCIE